MTSKTNIAVASNDASRPRTAAKGRARGLRKRGAIIDATRDLFVAQSFLKVSMDAIAARAGVSKATLYAHFPSKNGLFREVLSESVCDYIRVPRDLRNAPVEVGLRTLAQRFLDLVLSPMAIAAYRAILDHGEYFPEMVNVFKKTVPEKVLAAVADYFRHQTAVGDLYAPRPEIAARTFLHLVKSEPHARALMGRRSSAADREDIIGEAIRVTLLAYSPRLRPPAQPRHASMRQGP